ncbi:carnitine transporter [Mycoemilia scoparia]|uniref:Carnitine transporter n=1 Tax=Mycoemilia scoparia TaxID=417184 RepID=A0A9W8DT93_9FUNG|nr:carnitine transporter [Mycoemilia scoparia]
MSTEKTSTAPAATTVVPENPYKESIKSFLSGGFGGMCLVAAGHPLDLIKVRMQTSNQFSSTLQCFKATLASDGVRGLYRGMAAPLAGATPVFAICFWGYDLGKKLSRNIWGTDENTPLTTNQILFAGGFSALPTTLIMAPMERIKCTLQVQNLAPAPAGEGAAKVVRYSGPIDAAKGILKQGGLRSLFKGSAATLLRDVPGSVAYFGGYEAAKKLFTPAGSSPDKLSIPVVLAAGGIAGMLNWAVAIPPDVLKSRLQTAPDGRYSGVRQVFVELMKTEGPKALFRGIGPAMLRAFPANAACFMGVEIARKGLDSVW